MKPTSNISLNLTDTERKRLRKNSLKKFELGNYIPSDLARILEIPEQRAKEIIALQQFQEIPSIGIKFAHDLVFLGYYDIQSLQGKEGFELLDTYEKNKGFQTDPCVEDQFRLVVDYAKNGDTDKRWWDFTQERKKYRSEYGYPEDRPTLHWTDVKK